MGRGGRGSGGWFLGGQVPAPDGAPGWKAASVPKGSSKAEQPSDVAGGAGAGSRLGDGASPGRLPNSRLSRWWASAPPSKQRLQAASAEALSTTGSTDAGAKRVHLSPGRCGVFTPPGSVPSSAWAGRMIERHFKEPKNPWQPLYTGQQCTPRYGTGPSRSRGLVWWRGNARRFGVLTRGARSTSRFTRLRGRVLRSERSCDSRFCLRELQSRGAL